jgi:hypothetical protein
MIWASKNKVWLCAPAKAGCRQKIFQFLRAAWSPEFTSGGWGEELPSARGSSPIQAKRHQPDLSGNPIVRNQDRLEGLRTSWTGEIILD